MNSNSKFRIMRQGYDRFEVDKAVRKLEEEKAQLLEQVALNKSQILTLLEQRDGITKRFAQVTKDLSIREKAAEEMARLALREANSIIETAYGNADLIVREALSTARQLLIEISRISSQSQEIRVELNEKVEVLQEILQGLEFPEIPNIKSVGKDQDNK